MKRKGFFCILSFLLIICVLISCRMMAPIGLTELGSMGDRFEPEISFEGEALEVDVKENKIFLNKSGRGKIERLNEHCFRLKSDTGHISISLKPDEAIYGLTERIISDKRMSESHPVETGGLDRRGEEVRMWLLPTISTYAPFYISSRGYGMFVEGSWPGKYDIGKTDPEILRIGWLVGTDSFSCVFIFGDSYTEILDRYTEMTGRPVLPPRWAFLPLKWRNEVGKHKFAELDGVTMNAEVVDDILNFEKHGFPTGMYMIDRPWAEGTMGYGNFNWDPQRLPNGDEMVRVLHERGWRVIVWGAPWALGFEENDFGPEARKNGYVIGTRSIDYTNPEAAKWHRDKIEEFVRRSNIDGWKLDRSEEYNPSRKKDIYFDGRDGVEVHNDYPRMYIKAYYDGTRSVKGDDFVLIPRAGYTGSSSWGVVWGGDTRGHVTEKNKMVSTDLGLRSAIISLQRMAFMGYPVWGSDTGGYTVFTDRDVFARWLEFSCFCPLMEIGGSGSHEPWNMPTDPAYDEQMIKIFGRYTWVHTRLADYTYKFAKKANETGNPIVHPLIFDWPDDPKVKNMWDEYMYGPSLLVAPLWETGKRSRDIYLPKGEWTYLWDQSKVFSGPVTVNVKAPLDIIPVFINNEQASELPKNLIDGL